MKNWKNFNEDIKDANELDGGKRKLDLRGPDGNAYVVLNIAQNFCKQLKDVDSKKYDWEKIKAEMTSGDYENLINVFDKYFGDFIDIYR